MALLTMAPLKTDLERVLADEAACCLQLAACYLLLPTTKVVLTKHLEGVVADEGLVAEAEDAAVLVVGRGLRDGDGGDHLVDEGLGGHRQR
eukprot:scaffold57175_cov63-Phaeocystis_antarctica.AAC.6